MALELKAALEVLGIDVTDVATLTPEEFKKKVDERFITLDEAPKNEAIMKKAIGSFGFEINDLAKKAFNLDKAEIKELSTKEIIALAAKKQADKIAELTEAATKGNDDKVKELSGKLEKIQGQANQYKELLDKTAGELENEKTNFTKKVKEFKVGDFVKGAKSKLAFSDGVNDVTKLGFDSLIGSKYVIDLDDTDNPVITDKKGQKIPHPKKTGTFLTVEEVLDMELDAAGLKKKNNLNGNQKFDFNKQNANNGNNGQTTGRQVAPAAQKILNK